MGIEAISNNIRRLRGLRELTQENVANDLGISLTAYGRIEKGKADISLSRLRQIADYFEVSESSLLTEKPLVNSVKDSFSYQFKRKELRRLEEELAEIKADLRMIKAHLFPSNIS